MTGTKVCLRAPQSKCARSFYGSRVKSLQKCHFCWGCLNSAKHCRMTCAPLPAKWQHLVFAAHPSLSSLVWQGTGQQRVGSVSPVLTFADMIHTERASSEGEEMGVWEGGVERETEVAKRNLWTMRLERWWNGKSRKPECRTRMDRSRVTHSEESLEARPEDRN